MIPIHWIDECFQHSLLVLSLQSLRTPGVSLIAPPNSIKYLSQSQAQKSKAKDTSQILAASLVELTRLLMGNKAGGPANGGASPPSSVHKSFPDSLISYLKFLYISEIKCQAVYYMLISNNIKNFQIFGSLTYEDSKNSGLA